MAKWYQMELFHGSEQKLDVIRPMGVNMGSRFGKPHWASYFWRSFEEALHWAVFQYLRRVGKLRPMYHVPTGKFIVTEDKVQQVYQALLNQTTYVYKVVAPIVEVGVGSSPDIHEFTLEKDQVPTESTEVKMTRSVIDGSMLVYTEAQLKAYLNDLQAGKFTNRRGFFLGMLLDRDRDFQRHRYHKLMNLGQLKPGDDLSAVSLESRPASAYWGGE